MAAAAVVAGKFVQMSESIEISEISFELAVEQFREFLADNGLPTELLWVFKEDVFCKNGDTYGTDFWLKLPLPDENEKIAKTLFKIGKTRDLGIAISGYARCEGKICCGLILPLNEEEFGYMMMSKQYMKYTFVIDMPEAKAVKSTLKWKMFSLFPWKYKPGNSFEYLRSKKNLQFPAD